MAEATIASVKAVSARLLTALAILMGILLVLFLVLLYTDQVVTLPIVLIFGALGAFISLQRRLKQFSEEDLALFRESIPFTWLAPVSGAVLAGILYILFISGLLAGELFPTFVPNVEAMKDVDGIARIFYVSSDDPADYGKLLFWCFVAGFSERFVTDIIGRFQSRADDPG